MPFPTLPRDEIRNIRGERFLLGANKILPLGRKYHSIVQLLNGRRGLLSIPFEKHRVLRPAVWSKSVTNQLLAGTDSISEFELLRPVCAQLRPGVVVDTGANIGLYTLLFRSSCANPIVAFEPQPFLFKLLQWNIALNKLPNIEALNLACGAARGELTFWLGVNGSVVSGGEKTAAPPPIAWNPQNDWKQEELLTRDSATIKVPVTTLDEQLAGHPSIALLKIDCEGFEYNIIQGARELLKKHKPILFIEVHPEPLRHFGQSTEALLKLLDSAYDFEFWHFRLGRHHSKLALSLAKFRRPKAQQWSNAAEMLAAAASVPGPAQIYWLGRPKS